MDKKKKIILLVGLTILCILGIFTFTKALHMYRNTHRKLDDILTLTSSPKEESLPAEDSLTLLVNNKPVILPLNGTEREFDCQTLNTEFDTLFTTEDTGHEIFINGEKMENQSHSLLLDSISATDRITVTVDGQNYFLRTLPSDFPLLTPLGEGSEDGYYYTTFGDFVVKFDTKGQVVFYRKATVSNTGPFRRTELDGEVIYSYLQARASREHPYLAGVSYRTTALILLNEQYQKIGEVPYMTETDKLPARYPLENHDYLILGKNHYILTTYVGKKVNNIPESVAGSAYGANVVACIFQEIKDGKCIFEWDSTEHPELYAASMEGGDYTNASRLWSDYAHFNAISIDPKDNNFVCSYRNLDSILKIDRKTGEILWFLGGQLDDFNLSEDQQFHRQHNVTFTEDGSLLLFDNGCRVNIMGYPVLSEEEIEEGKRRQRSRVLKITLDENTKTVTAFKEYSVDGFYSASMGSAQILDDSSETVLFGWGGKSMAGMPLFSEVNCSKKLVNFEMLCGDSEINCYRVNYYYE